MGLLTDLLGDGTASGGGGGGHAGLPAYVSGRYYDSRLTNVVVGQQSSAKDILRFVPFYCQSEQTFDRIAINVNTAGDAGSVVRLGIYEATGGVPGALVASSAALAIDTTGAKEDTAFSVTLQPGWYFLAHVHNSTSAPVFSAIDNASGAAPHMGSTSAFDGSGYQDGMAFAAFTYAALPDPAPSVSYIATLDLFCIQLRAA